MYAQRQKLARFVEINLPHHNLSVRAHVNILLARYEPFYHLGHFRMQKRLSAGNADYRRAALLYCSPRFLFRHAFGENFFRELDFSAPRARQIALEQRLQHHYERIALLSFYRIGKRILCNR